MVDIEGDDSSFAASEKKSQLLMQRDEKIEDLQRQIQQSQVRPRIPTYMHCRVIVLTSLQTSRDALLEEVSFLSSKLSEWEDKMASFPSVQADNALLRERNDALLILLGEKEEELESLLQDMQDVKNLYKCEIEHLLSKIVPVASSTSTSDSSSPSESRPVM